MANHDPPWFKYLRIIFRLRESFSCLTDDFSLPLASAVRKTLSKKKSSGLGRKCARVTPGLAL
jgi:hypothetical protein